MTRTDHFFYDTTMSEPRPMPQAGDLDLTSFTQKVEEAAAHALDYLRAEAPGKVEHDAQRP